MDLASGDCAWLGKVQFNAMYRGGVRDKEKERLLASATGAAKEVTRVTVAMAQPIMPKRKDGAGKSRQQQPLKEQKSPIRGLAEFSVPTWSISMRKRFDVQRFGEFKLLNAF